MDGPSAALGGSRDSPGAARGGTEWEWEWGRSGVTEGDNRETAEGGNRVGQGEDGGGNGGGHGRIHGIGASRVNGEEMAVPGDAPEGSGRTGHQGAPGKSRRTDALPRGCSGVQSPQEPRLSPPRAARPGAPQAQARRPVPPLAHSPPRQRDSLSDRARVRAPLPAAPSRPAAPPIPTLTSFVSPLSFLQSRSPPSPRPPRPIPAPAAPPLPSSSRWVPPRLAPHPGQGRPRYPPSIPPTHQPGAGVPGRLRGAGRTRQHQ